MPVQPAPASPQASPAPAAGNRRIWLPAIWGGLFLLALVINVRTELADAASHGANLPAWKPMLWEATSVVVWICLLPVLYRLHRRWPLGGGWWNLAVHAVATVPYSMAHIYGMFALRSISYDLAGLTYPWPDLGDLAYEYPKDIFTYVILSGVLLATDHLLDRPRGGEPLPDQPAPPEAGPVPDVPSARLERFAVKRKGREVMISAADIHWIEAAGNYAILHLGDERFEIRSTLSRLERELDPDRFLRTHKSSIVNLTKVREVEPWFNGDYRILLEGGAVVNLSRRYRPRFESAVPIKG